MDEPPQKRFKYASYNERLKAISLDKEKGKATGWADEDFGSDDEQSSTPMSAEIARLSIHDLTIPYQELSRQLRPLTTSLPIILHNASRISDILYNFYNSIQSGGAHLDSGLQAALTLHQAFLETCISEVVDQLPTTTKHLLRIGSLPALDPKLVEKTFSTLGAILRLLATTLVKSAHIDILRATWSCVNPYVKRGKENKAYVRRCVSEAWSGVVRKARGEGLVRLMAVMHEASSPGMELVWVETLKGQGKNLHSRAPEIIDILLDSVVNDNNTLEIKRMVMIALVHHCNSTTLAPVVEAILSRINISSEDATANTSMARLLTTCLAVRKGKRVPEILLKSAMQKLQSLVKACSETADDLDYRRVLVDGVISSLMAGQLATWLSPGVALIEVVWQKLPVGERYIFVDSLIALKWPGVEQFILPHIVKTALPTLQTNPLDTVVLFNRLASGGFLAGGLLNVQGGRWRSSLVQSISQLLSTLSNKENLSNDDSRVLCQLLHFIPTLSNDGAVFVPDLISLLQDHISASDDSREEWIKEGPYNITHRLASVLECAFELASTDDSLRNILDASLPAKSLERLIETVGFSREVLKVLADYTEIRRDDTISQASLLVLSPNLLSADVQLRTATLRLFVNSWDGPSVENQSPKNSMIKQIWQACLAVESAEMSLKKVREKTTELARLKRLLQSVDQNAEQLDTIFSHVINFLLSQLKVGYRPLWTETVSVLADLAKTHPDAVWTGIWQQLSRTMEAKKQLAPDLDVEEPEWLQAIMKEERMVEKEDELDVEFRCTNLARVQEVCDDAWMGVDQSKALDRSEAKTQISANRLDILNFEAQLLAGLAAAPQLAEKHTRELVPMFFRISGHSNEEIPGSFSMRQLQKRTINFLELFTKFVNPKAAYRSEDLHSSFLDLLAKPQSQLQTLALKCLIIWRSSALTTYNDELSAFLDDSKFRDNLTQFALGVDSGVIDPSHREELLPVTIRIMYGIVTSRRGRSSARATAAKRQAVLSALSGCSSEELATLVDLMAQPFESDKDVSQIPGRQQMGFLRLLEDVLKYLGVQITAYWPRLLRITIRLIEHAQSTIHGEEIEEANDEDEDEDDAKMTVPNRTIRSIGTRRIIQFIKLPAEFDFQPYLADIFKSVISPRLDKLEVENTQAPSGVLDLIAVMAANFDIARDMSNLDSRAIPKTFACLTSVKVKPSVISRVFEVIESLLPKAEEDLSTTLLLPNMQVLLDNLIGCVDNLKQSRNEDLMRRLLQLLARIAVVVQDGKQAQQLVSLLSPMLRQPSRQVPEKAKLTILESLKHLFAISPEFSDTAGTFFTWNYETLSSLLQTIFFPASRKALVDALQVFSVTDPGLHTAISLTSDINAYSTRRIEEPDFDRRLSAFATINDEDTVLRTPREWLPLVRSALFFLQEPEELSIRTNAAALLRKFIAQIGPAFDGPMVDMMISVLLPGLRQTLRSKLELVRNEALQVISYGVSTCPGIPILSDLQPLLGAEDEETNFFTNIVHIQVHRRTRALHRLREISLEYSLNENSISTIFMPILEHIITGATDITDHHLVNEAILAIGTLTKSLRWSRYHGSLLRYLRLGTIKTPQQKFYIRTVSAVIDNFHFDLGKDVEVEEVEDDEEEPSEQTSARQKITDVVQNRLLPALSKFVNQKDEVDDAIRIPVAYGIVKIASQLPDLMANVEVLRIITTVSQMLKSKEQNTRDLARETICKTAVYLGPNWLVRILKELRAALQRGPQKHVLGVTTHSILVMATSDSDQRFANLDDAVEDAVQISAEVIWGESGKDVESEGFKTKMREVRGAASRGYDTFQLIAKVLSPSKIGVLLAPLRDVMHASQAVKTMQHVDEAMRRIALGLNANAQLEAADILALCYSLISGNSPYLQAKKSTHTKAPKDRFEVQMKRKLDNNNDFYHLNAHKFVSFGSELFVTAFRRGKFDFDNVDILARLGPLVDAIALTLTSVHTNVLILGLKASAAIVRCPIPQVEAALPKFVSTIFTIIQNAGSSTESELVQTALKTMAVIIRDCRSSEVSDAQLKFLLDLVSPDLENPELQAALFAILRAIVSRQMVVPEIYDLMDRVSSIMVTSQSTHVQEQCRAVLMQFLLDYPQGFGRLKQQMTFLAQNLEYVFENGRISVMELLSAIFAKFSDDLMAEYADLFFVALVVVLANDESQKCRIMAGVLIKRLFSRMTELQQNKTLGILTSWIQTSHEKLGPASLSVWGLILETEGATTDMAKQVAGVVNPILQKSATQLLDAEESEDHEFLPHMLAHEALSAATKALKVDSTLADLLPWSAIIDLLLFPHDWVRFGAAKIIAVLFAKDVAFSVLDESNLLDIAKKSCLLLKGGSAEDGSLVILDGKIADQLVKILWNISRHWSTVAVAPEEDAVEDPDKPTKRPLPWLMSRLSYLARHLIISRPHTFDTSADRWAYPVMSILRFFAGISDHFEVELVKRYLVHILSPVHRILDDGGELANSSVVTGAVEELIQLATEVREFIQGKVGVSDFSQTWEALRKKTKVKREVRRETQNRMAMSDPQGWAERKEKRGVQKKESKKRKTKAFADSKQRERPTKRRV